jgi:flagellar biosynthesis component FlhA
MTILDSNFTVGNILATAATSVFAWVVDIPPMIFLGIGVTAQLVNLYWTWRQKKQEWEHREERHDAQMERDKKNGATGEAAPSGSNTHENN